MAEKHLHRKCENNHVVFSHVLFSVREISCDLIEIHQHCPHWNVAQSQTMAEVLPLFFSPLFLFLASVLLLVEVNHGLAFAQSPPVPPPLFHRLFWYCLQAAINYPLTTILRKRRPLEFSPGSLPWTFFHRISRRLVKASDLSPYKRIFPMVLWPMFKC